MPNTALNTPPVGSTDAAWREWLAAYHRAIRDVAERARRENGWCQEGVRDALRTLGVTTARNPVFRVTVVRSRVRARDAADAVAQVQGALRDVEFTDRSGVRRRFSPGRRGQRVVITAEELTE